MWKTKSQINFSKLISAFVFATWIGPYLYFLKQIFQASSPPLWLHSPVCVGPGRNPEWWLSHETAQFLQTGGRTGLVVRALDSGSGDPGSILSRVGVLFPWAKEHLLPKSTGNTQE